MTAADTRDDGEGRDVASLTRDGDDVQVLHLGPDENRWHPAWMADVAGLLDEAEEAGLPLVTTGGDANFSQGLVVEWLQANPTEYQSYLSDVHHLLSRFLTLPVPTVAAVTGHAFGAGAMLVLCHDLRVMRSDRGWWCLPEAALGMPFTPGMDALVRTSLPPDTWRRAMVTSHRFTAAEARDARIVTATADSVAATRDEALALARTTSDVRTDALRMIKPRAHAEVVALLHGG